MPFTPLHLGPGAAFKAAGGRHFSFMVFGGTQVLMDIEPLLAILLGWPVLHGYSHTLAGALLIGLVAGLIGRPISIWALRRLRVPHYPLGWGAAFAGAYVGTFSHLALDAVMHADMRPWWPITPANDLLGVISVNALHGLCLLLGAIGALLVGVSVRRRGRA